MYPCVKRTPTQTDGIAEASRPSVTQLNLVHEQPALYSQQVVVERTDNVRERANVPEDSIVAEMMKRLPPGDLYWITRMEGGMFDSPSSRQLAELVFLRKRDASAEKGIRGYRSIALEKVMWLC